MGYYIATTIDGDFDAALARTEEALDGRAAVHAVDPLVAGAELELGGGGL